MKVDPVKLEVMKGAFETIADEMAIVLMRTSFSSIVRDAMDFSTAVCDGQGLTLAQGLTTPLHLGSIFDAMQKLREVYRGNINEGDIFIGNDPYLAAGQHLPDVYMIKPLFAESEICGWAVALAHQVDIGGIVPGSNSLGATEIFQEGFRIPFLKLYNGGRLDDSIWQLLSINVRIPDMVLGDITAQIVSCNTAEREFSELAKRFGSDELKKYMNALNDYAEALTREELSTIKDGTYRFTHYIDGLGEDPEDITLDVTLTISGDEATVDWSGSSPQVKGGINSPFPFTKAAVYTALRSVMSNEIPTCHGFTVPISVVAQPGTIANPTSPAPCGARGITGFRMVDCLFGALASAVPERVAADGFGGSTYPTFASSDPQQTFIFSETLMGNSGGCSTQDGQEGITHMAANQSNVPVEVIETEYPIRIEYYGFEPDTCGAGEFRGGLALRRDYRMLADDISFYIRSDKRKHRPYGLYGGKPGSSSLNVLNPGSDEVVLPVLMTRPVVARKGDLVRHVMAGGGGYGNPKNRSRELVQKDLELEKITPEYAKEHYNYDTKG